MDDSAADAEQAAPDHNKRERGIGVQITFRFSGVSRAHAFE